MTDIFHEWKENDMHKGCLFITDGIIDKELWNKSDNKVMFLLKEAYDSKKESGTWDLPSLIRKRGVSGRTFKPMAQWAYGIHSILNGNGIAPYVENSKEVKMSLFSSAIVNLKKSAGKKSSGKNNLQKYVDEDWHLLSSQIKAISPQIIVCGKTWALIKDKLPNKKKITDSAYVSEGIIYLNFWHPSNRAANLMSYYSICAITEMALNEGAAIKL
ncbi:MAG: hypothetical protein WBF77_09045 [Sulfurimonadaceae bacterium]